MKIAGNLTIQDWIDLVGGIEDNEITIDYISNEKWSLAFYFFEERIRTRYLNPTKAILELGDNLGEGFAIVNLQCSLIEVVESFINGWTSEFDRRSIWKKNGEIAKYPNSENGREIKNVDIFISFFENRNPFNTYNIKGDLLFWNVRCALLHETQTKKNWKIKKTISHTDSYREEAGFKIIYRENFQNDLIKLIERYKEVIINGGKLDGISAFELRKNFVSKFNHICKESL